MTIKFLQFIITQALETVKKLCPKKTLLIGMTHELDYHKDNEYLMEWSRRYMFCHFLKAIIVHFLKVVYFILHMCDQMRVTLIIVLREGIPVQLARDGLRVPIEL